MRKTVVIIVVVLLAAVIERHELQAARVKREMQVRYVGYEHCTNTPPCGGDESCIQGQIETQKACARAWFGDKPK